MKLGCFSFVETVLSVASSAMPIADNGGQARMKKKTKEYNNNNKKGELESVKKSSSYVNSYLIFNLSILHAI